MNEIDFYAQPLEYKKMLVESRAKIRGDFHQLLGGMCGEIYVYDQGEETRPRFQCVKVPKPLKDDPGYEKAVSRFIRELELQNSFYGSAFVCRAFDFNAIENTPSASYRYHDGDLAYFLKEKQLSRISRLSLLAYACEGLIHCYSKGLIAHQDLKPANILVKDLNREYAGLGDFDIYQFALIADFGLANASKDYGVFDGTRPYLAPEQWKRQELSSATDVFALGVIFYEMMTGGLHPVGIQLDQFWPEPQNGNPKKWIRSDSWLRWINGGCAITPAVNPIEPEIIAFITQMLSIDPAQRPKIQEVQQFLLECIKTECLQSFVRTENYINYYRRQFSNNAGQKRPVFLNSKFEALINRFKS
ncbi:protein kinase [Flavobacterium collinsii]|uniref:protein kinase domain-containing protein n=1 Tax=Flavobacterium collinsii TaxID=1114861 RepID=UPI003757E832